MRKLLASNADTDGSGKTVPWVWWVAIAAGALLALWALAIVFVPVPAHSGQTTAELLEWETFFRSATLIVAAVVGFSSYVRKGELEKIRRDFDRLNADSQTQALIADRAKATIDDHIGNISGIFAKMEGAVKRLPEGHWQGNQGLVIRFPPSLNGVVKIDGYVADQADDRAVDAGDETGAGE